MNRARGARDSYDIVPPVFYFSLEEGRGGGFFA